MRFQSAVTQIVVSNMLIVGEKRGLISIIQHKVRSLHLLDVIFNKKETMFYHYFYQYYFDWLKTSSKILYHERILTIHWMPTFVTEPNR